MKDQQLLNTSTYKLTSHQLASSLTPQLTNTSTHEYINAPTYQLINLLTLQLTNSSPQKLKIIIFTKVSHPNKQIEK